MKNGYGQEVRWVLEEDMLAYLKETQTPEKYAEMEARLKELQEQTREQIAALRAKIGRPAVRMRNGGDPKNVIWPTVDEYCAQAKEKVSPEELESKKAFYRKMREQAEKGTDPSAEVVITSTDSEGRVTSAIMLTHSCHAQMPMEMITDPWTGQPRVFTEEEKAKYRLANRGWSPERRERFASFECKICNRLFREHSWQEFDDCQAQIEAPTVRLFGKGKRAKKETIARSKCEICSRIFGEHSQQEYDACINQRMKRHKPKREDLRYVKCEICSRRFGDHSSEEFDACIDQMIENSV
jgi:hypothetical protein